jgi:hypothetical protein
MESLGLPKPEMPALHRLARRNDFGQLDIPLSRFLLAEGKSLKITVGYGRQLAGVRVPKTAFGWNHTVGLGVRSQESGVRG